MASQKQLGNIVYEVELEVAKLIEGQREVNARLEKMSGSIDKSGNSLDKLGKKADSLGSGFTSLASAVKAYITVQAAMKIIDIAQQFELLATRVTMASKSAAEGESNFRSLLAISAQNGSDLKETVNLFTQMSATLKSVGATSGDVQRLVSTLQKIGTIGGSSQEEMNNALRQFMQSMASGRIQAEEFNSIIEQMPELGRQIADGMGIPFDQLRQLMLAGKLDIGSVLEAIYRQTDDVNSKFEDMPRTVSQASNALVNSLGMAAAQIDQKIGATKYFAKLLDGAALTVNFAAGNASAVELIDQKLIKNADDLKVAENSLNLAKKSGVDWAIKQAQATVDRIKGEQRLLTLSKQTAKEVQAVTSGQSSGGKTPEYIKNLAAKNAQNSAQAIISAGQTEVEKLQAQRNQLKTNYDKKLLDKATYAKADEVLSQKISDAQDKANKPAENASKKLEKEQQAVTDKLEALRQKSELAADSTQELSRAQAVLQAQQSLGKSATADQIKQAGDYAAKIWDQANAIKAQAAAEKLLPEARENASYKQDVQDLNTALSAKKISQEQYNQTSERLEAEHQANLAKIRSQQAVTPQQSAKGEVDPVQRLANQHAQELALIQQFEQEGLLAHQNALALKNAADTQYEQQRTAAQWELLSQQSLGYNMLTSAVDAFAGNASNALTGLLTGTMSAQDALRSLGNTILNSVINSMVQVGVEALKNMIIGQTIGAASSAASIAQAALVASAWAPAAAMASLATLGGNAAPAAAGITSTVGLASGLALAGMRYNGGPVSAGGLYQVGEKGKPEIYQASTGKQYMIPGDNGRVISNKDMQAGGGINVVVNVQNYNGSSVDAQATSDGNGGLTVDVIVADLNNGGPISNAITSNMNVKRTPRGQG
ncbi:tape measure domain-containing protein [Cronobacter malonaticus]|uniref:Tape measure domain-containing protein n=1 Tax=Cronobacter malonaticus TaxID=413503 RepID=V5U427_9ENTR|nr:tape measure protein [Cronobacter malonaticus]AHB71569.1 tape measure domain-containing protein [Cronobacter malonaticus]